MLAPKSITFFCGLMHVQEKNEMKYTVSDFLWQIILFTVKKLIKCWNVVVFSMLFSQIHLIWPIETANPNTIFHKESKWNMFKTSIALFFPLTFNLLQTSVFHRAKNDEKSYNFENLIKISCEWLISTQMKRSFF